MAPFLYDDITDQMRNLILMQCVVKSAVLETADTPRKLIAIDLKDDNCNQRLYLLAQLKKQGLGMSTVDYILMP